MITKEQLKKLCPPAKDAIITDVAKYFNIHADEYGVNTPIRIRHFMAQAAHESDSFKTLQEYASGQAYEGRRDLGNTQAGDGRRFKGRGIFQLTGRANYDAMSRKLNVDLISNPDLAATPEISVLTALEYWKSRSLNTLADGPINGSVRAITKKINGGFNGLEERQRFFDLGKNIFTNLIINNETPDEDSPPEPTANTTTTTMLAVVMAKKGDKSDYVKDLQEMLIRHGHNIIADGDFGPRTESAVKAFQKSVGLPDTGVIDANTLTKMVS